MTSVTAILKYYTTWKYRVVPTKFPNNNMSTWCCFELLYAFRENRIQITNSIDGAINCEFLEIRPKIFDCFGFSSFAAYVRCSRYNSHDTRSKLVTLFVREIPILILICENNLRRIQIYYYSDRPESLNSLYI